MLLLLSGVAVLGVTVVFFWFCLPRGGKCHRFVDTELEPYIGVAFCSGFALAFTMILSATINMLGTP